MHQRRASESCASGTHRPPSFCTWRKVGDGYNKNIFCLPKHRIRISRVFATLIMRPIVRNTGCDPLFFTTPVGTTHCVIQHCQFRSIKTRLHPKTLFEIAMVLSTNRGSFPLNSHVSATFSILLRFGESWNPTNLRDSMLTGR